MHLLSKYLKYVVRRQRVSDDRKERKLCYRYEFSSCRHVRGQYVLYPTFKARGVNFQENPSSGSENTGENTHCSPLTVPVIVVHREQTCTVCRAYGVSGKSLVWNLRYSREVTLFAK